MKSNTERLREFIIECGATEVGFANLSCTLPEERYNLEYGISIVKSLNPNIIRNIVDGPTLEYYEEYKRVNEILNRIAKSTAEYINDLGFEAYAQPATVSVVDKNNRTAFLPHKTVATLSGLGWIGKSALLVTEEYGSALRLTTVFTNLILEVGKPKTYSECRNCKVCVESCPGQAITGNNWEPSVERSYIYDADKCKAEALRRSSRVGINNTICGICINVCPYTQKYLKGNGS